MHARAVAAILGIVVGSAGSAQGVQIAAELIVSGLQEPLFVTHAPGDGARLFVVQKAGQVRVIEDGWLLPDPLLDISSLVNGAGLQGLLGLAFHPDYPSNGLLYVSYVDLDGSSVIAEFQVGPGNPNLLGPGGGVKVLALPQPPAAHKHGWIAFGPDGFLWASTGDGGSPTCLLDQAQDLATLYGKMLRIDIDADDFPDDPDRNYGVPPDNPFVGLPGARAEIWSSGLRQPWRCSFDRETGDLYIGDVGGAMIEEINFQPASSRGGENYGWMCMEGSICGPGAACGPPDGPSCVCGNSSLVRPIYQYVHGATGNFSVTGGYVYRGAAIPALRGTYVFSDFSNRKIFALRHDGTNVSSIADLTARFDPPGPQLMARVSSFGEDADGEIYFCDYDEGRLYKIISTCPTDLDGNAVSDRDDMVILMAAWGTNPGGPPDFDGDGTVAVLDLLTLLGLFGPCP